ncbi:MAG: DUF5591 domain-containing protein [Candidatus Thorarchaeota archaeon]
MVEFSVGRGHDGPARSGKLMIGELEVSLPTLIGPSGYGLPLSYATLGRDKPESGVPIVLSLPFSIEINSHNLTEVGTNNLVLLPSLPSLSELSASAAQADIHYQLESAKKLSEIISPSQIIIRISHNLNPDELTPILSELTEIGVRIAAIQITGSYDSRDLDSLMLRSHLPRDWVVVALGRVHPHMIPLLYYLGVDILDIGHAWESASFSRRLWRLDSEKITDRPYRYCMCSTCQGVQSLSLLDSDELDHTLVQHNGSLYKEVLSESEQALNSGTLRWLIESFTHATPTATSLLRQIDTSLYSFLEEFTPTTGSGVVQLIGPESYNSPPVKRFRDILSERYTPPVEKRIILLLPCSAKKPYSNSKSHKRLGETLDSALGNIRHQVAETILTSPLGVVPRELERIYPAANYNIPVTGTWDAEEIKLAADALVTHLGKFDEPCVVVAHVKGGYRDIVQAAEDRVTQSIIYTIDDKSPTSRDSMESLTEVLRDLRELLSLESSPPTSLRDTLRATADFQFGEGVGKILIPDAAKFSGKLYRMVIARYESEQLCSYIADSGLLSLTIAGARRIAHLNRYWVRFKGTEIKGGSLFAIGIDEADPNIRPGDEVVIIGPNDEVMAVGRSEMSGSEMCAFKKGRGVTIRHKLGGSK